MTAIVPPLFQTIDSVYTGADLGLPYRDLVTQGVVGDNDLKVSQRGAGANMSVDVAPGVIWVAGDDSVFQPSYRCYNDGVVNLTIAASHATLDRRDLVVAEVRDAAFSGVSTDWRIRVITGTPDSVPVTPTEPSNAVALAVVQVPGASTSVPDANILDYRPYATAGSRVVRRVTKTSSTTINATSEGAANTILTAPTLACDGGRYRIEFTAPGVEPVSAAGGVAFVLHDGTNFLAHIGTISVASGEVVPVNILRTLAPAPGLYQFSVRAYRYANNMVVAASIGGSSNYGEAELLITRLGRSA